MSHGAPLLEIERAVKRYGSVAAVDDVSLDVGEGEFFALLGPSGCGKTTLMRLVAGFEAPDAGRVRIAGADMTGLPPEARPVNMMFQSYALFPHMSVEKNIAFGLVQQGLGRDAVRSRVAEMLRLVQLEAFAARAPHQLSGGQRARVALARALARGPRLVMLDEPLAALDRKLREETQFEVTRLQRETGASFMVVTHDQEEAMGMASRLAVMRAGRIEQVGAPAEIYDAPASRFVAGFIGETNLFEAVVVAASAGEARFEIAREKVAFVAAGAGLAVGQKVALAVRPAAVELARESAGAVNAITGQVTDIAFRGDASLVRLAAPSGAMLRASAPRELLARLAVERGETVVARFAPSALRVLTQ